MQKALDQMNIQLHHVISDITGTTGLAIVEALPAGERDPETIGYCAIHELPPANSSSLRLVGNYHSEHLFALRQSLLDYLQYQALDGGMR
jgi:hypothetical protein